MKNSWLVGLELSNHLQNVLVTISDKKIPHTTDGTTIDYYNPDVITANDFYPLALKCQVENTHNQIQPIVTGLMGRRMTIM